MSVVQVIRGSDPVGLFESMDLAKKCVERSYPAPVLFEPAAKMIVRAKAFNGKGGFDELFLVETPVRTQIDFL